LNYKDSAERLKKIRQTKGLSLEEVSKQTKVHLNILRAIEGDSLTNLNPVYLKSFIKIYCNFLKVSPADFVSDYKETQARVIISGPKKKYKPKVSLHRSFVPNMLKLSPGLIKKILIAASFLCILIVLFNLGKGLFLRRKDRLPASGLATEEKIVPIHANPKSAEQKQDKAKAQALSGINLFIKTKQSCWISLRADGRLVIHRALDKGRSESWSAKEKMELSLSNAAAVELQVNGKLFSSLGHRGQSIKAIITKEGLRILR
jgi:cytoskeletal protein RodZ